MYLILKFKIFIFLKIDNSIKYLQKLIGISLKIKKEMTRRHQVINNNVLGLD